MENNENVIITGTGKRTIASIIFLVLAILSLVFAVVRFFEWLFFVIRFKFNYASGLVLPIIGVCVAVGFYVLSKQMSKYQITVTNKRIRGKCPFGKQVDLPLDSVSVVAKDKFNTIVVATSSGRIAFRGIPNFEQIFVEINKLLSDRQTARNTPTIVNQQVEQSSADELKKFKELFDNGVITQQEFEEKKRQLLDL